MPPAFWIVLPVSLLIVLTSSASSSRAVILSIALLVPLILTQLVYFLNMFLAEDYALGWPFIIGSTLVLVPSAAACVLGVIISIWLKPRANRENDPNI